jgi:SAM-dependent methyltransferase
MTKTIDNPYGYSTMSSEIKNAHNYNSWLVSKIKPFIGNSVMEIGTGYGNFYELIQPLCNNYYSIDIDASAIENAKKKNPDCTYFLGDIVDSAFAQLLSKNLVDTIICLNVLEHIKDDKMAIENMNKILGKKGFLIVFVPAFQILYSSMDKFAGHHRRYTFSLFNELINTLRIEVICLEYFNPIGGIGWYFNKFLNHKELDSKLINKQIKIFDKYIIPISIFLNPVTKNIFGQSLLFIGRKLC